MWRAQTSIYIQSDEGGDINWKKSSLEVLWSKTYRKL